MSFQHDYSLCAAPRNMKQRQRVAHSWCATASGRRSRSTGAWQNPNVDPAKRQNALLAAMQGQVNAGRWSQQTANAAAQKLQSHPMSSGRRAGSRSNYNYASPSQYNANMDFEPMQLPAPAKKRGPGKSKKTMRHYNDEDGMNW